MRQKMIEKDEVISLILEACPSFQEKWNDSDDKELPYIVMGDLADHLLALYRVGKTECQSALKNDPPSASKIDPPQLVSFCQNFLF
jgi:hypothetical protein